MNYGKITKLTKAVLSVIGTAVEFSFELNRTSLAGMFDKVYGMNDPAMFKSRLNQAVKRLEHRRLIVIRNGRVRLTTAGEKELALYETKNKPINRPKKWDGKWRIVIFDIWERRRNMRDTIRRYLSHLGFVYLQNSVWVFPYECREVVDLLKTRHKLRPAVIYIVAESIENDRFLRKKFGLPDIKSGSESPKS